MLLFPFPLARAKSFSVFFFFFIRFYFICSFLAVALTTETAESYILRSCSEWRQLVAFSNRVVYVCTDGAKLIRPVELKLQQVFSYNGNRTRTISEHWTRAHSHSNFEIDKIISMVAEQHQMAWAEADQRKQNNNNNNNIKKKGKETKNNNETKRRWKTQTNSVQDRIV